MEQGGINTTTGVPIMVGTLVIDIFGNKVFLKLVNWYFNIYMHVFVYAYI